MQKLKDWRMIEVMHCSVTFKNEYYGRNKYYLFEKAKFITNIWVFSLIKVQHVDMKWELNQVSEIYPFKWYHSQHKKVRIKERQIRCNIASLRSKNNSHICTDGWLTDCETNGWNC